MAGIKTFYQCKLRHFNTETIGWIPARGAKVGAAVELLPDKQIWVVIEVYEHGLPEEVLKEYQLLNRKSLPSVQAMG